MTVDFLAILIAFVLGLFAGTLIPRTDYNDLFWKLLEARTEIEALVKEIKMAREDGKITREEFDKIIERLEEVIQKLRQ